jgi:energy-coupling factor transporter ATP-binding protein EcfA2
MFMATIVFVLGRPGSGKSTAVRHILKLARRRNLAGSRVNDYDILKDMFLTDRTYQRFEPTEYGGFDVTDFSVLDEALRRAEQAAKLKLRSSAIVAIEFARDDYIEALKQFRPAFLKDAFFIYINTDVATCIRRIHTRVMFPTTPDDHFVSENILKTYYRKQNVSLDLEKEFGISKDKINVVNNRSSRHDFDMKINRIINSLLERKVHTKYQKRVYENVFVNLKITRSLSPFGKLLKSIPAYISGSTKSTSLI